MKKKELWLAYFEYDHYEPDIEAFDTEEDAMACASFKLQEELQEHEYDQERIDEEVEYLEQEGHARLELEEYIVRVVEVPYHPK